jgi:NAD(P)-dependent dehydrogenase (short-subunit alcohol dehydrogenase family)
VSKHNKKVALITGANKGIGFEISRQLASNGITVVAGARSEERGHTACRRLRDVGMDVHFQRINVTDEGSIYSAIAKIREKFSHLDILVNNAGVMIDDQEKTIMDLNRDTLTTTLVTNAFGPFLLCQACIPLMRENNYGRIVNMASTLGSLTDISDPGSLHGGVEVPAYRISKAFLNAITALFAKVTRGSNILINSACPGWVRTDMGGEQAPLTAAQGADTPVWLATLPDNGPTGGFFRERQRIPW